MARRTCSRRCRRRFESEVASSGDTKIKVGYRSVSTGRKVVCEVMRGDNKSLEILVKRLNSNREADGSRRSQLPIPQPSEVEVSFRT
jgi:hypothetical protein